jgi:mannose-6-phosphate isomerase-like protein (cupin superfamily)
VYCISQLGAPWGLRVQGESVAKFHLVLDGDCWLRVDADEPMHLGAGELIILPRGDSHTISDSVETPARDLDRILAEHPLDADAVLSYGGSATATRLLCGGFVLENTMPT